jgi:competence ComEA-like helix-hairpin-helix protein
LKNLLDIISKKLELTGTEVNTTIFVLIVFTLGIIARSSKIELNEQNFNSFDYSFHDSLFKALKNERNKNLLTIENSEKKVDSELELSDFSNSELDSKKKKVLDPLKLRINLNKADLETLTKLPGIGPKTAEKIIELRTQKGRFNNLNELTEVKGIGSKKFNNIKNFLFLEK